MSKSTITTIWLNKSGQYDSNVHMCLCKLDPYLVTFCNTDKCIDFITNMEEDVEGKVLLIISIEMFPIPVYTMLQLCEELAQIDSIYILDSTEMEFTGILATFTKVRGVYKNSKALYDFVNPVFNIRRQRRGEYVYDDFIISILPSSAIQSTAITTNNTDYQRFSSASIDRQEAEFMYLLFLREILIRIKSTREEMIKFCQEKYTHNESYLKMIEEFKLYYAPENAILWYTRETFLFRLLNAALREQDIDTLYSLRYFITDLFLLLEEHFLRERLEQNIEIIYRGQLMNTVEFNKKIRDNTGGFFSVNSFFSTTLNRQVAAAYAGDGTILNEESVLFEIEVDTDDIKAAYTNISTISAFGDGESEILFSMGAVFRIKSAIKNEQNIWIVKLKLTDNEDDNLRELMIFLKEEIITSNRLISLARLLSRMSYYEKAEKYYDLVLQNPSIDEDPRILSSVYAELGFVYFNSKQYEKAIEFYKKSLKIDLQLYPDTDIKFVVKYSNLVCIYLVHGAYHEAVSAMNKAIEISQYELNADDSVIENLVNNIANLYRSAIHNHEKLQLYENRKVIQDNLKSIMRDNPDSLSLGNDIGNIFYIQQNYSEAHEMYKRCLDNQLKFFPSNHPRIAETYHYIALVYYAQGQYDQAIEVFTKELNIQETAYQPNHLDMGTTYYHLAWSYYQQDQFKESLQCCQKKYDIDLKYFPNDHSKIDQDLESIARITKELNET
ncbi:hypothetical protein I4U23_016230 [Adineta vaga]|nr:hypothetical protein I4U23_016230 [Adineta vaga]